MGILALPGQHSISTAPTLDRLTISSPASSSLSSDAATYRTQERGWKLPAPPSPPMSHYDHPRSDVSPTFGHQAEDDGSLTGREQQQQSMAASSHPPKPQLPSLSSLFGPPSAMGRPLGAPFSRTDSFASSSSLDRPRILPSPRERSQSGSAMFLPQPLSRTRSTHESRFDKRTPPPVGPSRTFTGPFQSPQLQSVARPPSRTGTGLGMLQPGRARDDGLLMPGESYDGHHHHQQQQVHHHQYQQPPQHLSQQHHHHHGHPHERPQELSMAYRGMRQAPPAPSSAPASTPTTVEGIQMSKDGLGPKIWTGTHFLPRFVRAAEVSGEGLCYFYDDGSHCKTMIDGEVVNPHWGVTKAGKPRKRLAIACMTCREKKIKCDPDFPRCIQCEKFGRQCQFKNAPRGGHAITTSPSTPPAELDEFRRLGPMAPPATTVETLKTDGAYSQSSPSISPRTVMRPSSPEIATPSSAASNKRPRLSYDSYDTRMSGHVDEARPWMQYPHQGVELPRLHDAVLRRPWTNDSYIAEPTGSTLPPLQALGRHLKRSLSPEQ